MREIVEVKLRQAEEQTTLWQRNLAAAQEQVTRWSAVAQAFRELLGEAEERKSEGAEEQESEGAEEGAGLGS